MASDVVVLEHMENFDLGSMRTILRLAPLQPGRSYRAAVQQV